MKLFKFEIDTPPGGTYARNLTINSGRQVQKLPGDAYTGESIEVLPQCQGFATPLKGTVAKETVK